MKHSSHCIHYHHVLSKTLLLITELGAVGNTTTQLVKRYICWLLGESLHLVHERSFRDVTILL